MWGKCGKIPLQDTASVSLVTGQGRMPAERRWAWQWWGRDCWRQRGSWLCPCTWSAATPCPAEAWPAPSRRCCRAWRQCRPGWRRWGPGERRREREAGREGRWADPPQPPGRGGWRPGPVRLSQVAGYPSAGSVSYKHQAHGLLTITRWGLGPLKHFSCQLRSSIESRGITAYLPWSLSSGTLGIWRSELFSTLKTFQ